jgi:hypothetical protein
VAVRKRIEIVPPVRDLEVEEGDLQLHQEVKAMIRKRLAMEWGKGLLAYPVAIAGGVLMWWSSKSSGFSYWSGTISGLVILSVGMGYGGAFIKLLISGDLPKATVVELKDFEMKEWMKVFFAFLSIGGGVCFILTAGDIAFYLPIWVPYFIGIVLIAAGVTYFWTRSKLYRG